MLSHLGRLQPLELRPIDLDHRNVRIDIRPDHTTFNNIAVVELDGDSFRSFHHMRIGDQMSIRIEYPTRSAGIRAVA